MFTDLDTLEALLGDRKASVALLSRYDLRQLKEATLEQLLKVPHVGPARAARLLAAFALADLLRRLPAQDQPLVSEPEAVYQIVGPRLQDQQKEEFAVLLLNTKNRLLAELTVSVGHLSASLVHPREVFREAVRYGAAAVIAVHNHPSGDPDPSNEDLVLTARLIQAGRLVGVPLLDHIIVGQGCFKSLRQSSDLWVTETERRVESFIVSEGR